MQRKEQAIEYALSSLINLLQHDIQVLQQLVEEIRGAKQGDLNELITKLDAQKKKQENQERHQLREKKHAQEHASGQNKHILSITRTRTNVKVKNASNKSRWTRSMLFDSATRNILQWSWF
jgi:predicted RecB family endonuclease